jgi:hypothetical protein
MPAKRTVFLHYHLYKNAGTTIDRLFERSPGGSTPLEARDENGAVENAELVSFVRSHPKVFQVTSHGIRPPRPEIPGCHVVDIAFFRHPVDRFRSIYDFSRADPRDGAQERMAKQLSLGDFAAWMARELPFNFFSPQTTIFGSSGDFFHPPTAADLERAKARVQQVRMLGTVELFRESLFTASRFLRAVAPQTDFLGLPEAANVSAQREATLEERIARVQRELGAARYRWLLESLAEDMALWEFATAEVRRRHRLASLWDELPGEDGAAPGRTP